MGTTGSSGRGKGSSAAPGGKSARPKVSAKVYRRRRLVAVIFASLVVGALVAAGFFIAGLVGSDTGAAQPDETGQGVSDTTETAKAPVKVGTPPSDVCDEAGIKVSASVDKPSYAGDELPVLTLQVTNSGKTACDINVGTSQMEYVITSGDDIIFNSKFCAAELTDLVKNLAPGASEKANMVWHLNRTAPDCAKVVSEPGRGGATYVLVATLGKWSSDKVPFTLE